MVHPAQSNNQRGAKEHPGGPALALRKQPMVLTVASPEAREVVRCNFCRLVQFRTVDSNCRKCHRPIDVEDPVVLAPQLVTAQSAPASGEAGMHVAGQVREIRRTRHMSQRQLACKMMVPRTYISKIENGKAIPTLGSLERLALALGVDISQLVRDARSVRDEEVARIFADPFLAEIASLLPHLDSVHRTLLSGAIRDAVAGRRRSA